MEAEELICLFKMFMETALEGGNVKEALTMLADDVIGIGMGTQGIVSSKADVERIITDSKPTSEGNKTTVQYENMQVRCYKDSFASVCGVLKVCSILGGKAVESTLGQLMNLRRENGEWRIYTLQATPLFNAIEEMEAYPIKFAENVLEKYRQQEQMAKNAQSESVGIYSIDFTKGIFVDSVLKNDMLIQTKKNERYEAVMFDAARRYLSEEDRYKFISLFSIGNAIKAYQSGQTELWMEYQMLPPGRAPIWMKTVIKLYTDKMDKSLKGYLYVLDIDEEKRKTLVLKSEAELDSLTALYNKIYTEHRIAERIRTLGSAGQGAFLMVDLDYFKNINDTYGHQEGDRVLREAADCIRAVMRKSDIAGRLGGDEFCIYFQGDLTEELVENRAKQLCESIRGIIPAEENGTSCSIGIAFCTNPEQTFQDIYRLADRALYERKRCGRNGYTIYTKTIDKDCATSDHLQ